MAYVITDGCIDDVACLDACPVGCIHLTRNEPATEWKIQINSQECNDCGACVTSCPISVIYRVGADRRRAMLYKEDDEANSIEDWWFADDLRDHSKSNLPSRL